MANLNDILKLAKQDGGRFFVIDESGDVKLVIMNIEDYLKNNKNVHVASQKHEQLTEDVERINRELAKAKSQDPELVIPEITISQQAPQQPRLGSKPQSRFQDLREEVIDPTFDFEGPKPGHDEI